MYEVLQEFDKLNFTTDLVEWYKQNKRMLPWRQTTDPYKIWISEIMLQQTQVDTVIPYYEHFIKKFPTVEALAMAEEREVLKLWEGLGYYSRARNLHQAAKMVTSEYNGEIPQLKGDLKRLKGIGPYTSGAILSIAFNQPEPAVDGNVFRVISRLLGIYDNVSEGKTRKKFEAIVSELLKKSEPSALNQGLMELGATICTPKQPLCLHCPVKEYCSALAEGDVLKLPVKHKAKKQRQEYFTVVILENELGELAMEQRPKQGLLANMWQFPMLEGQNMSLQTIEQSFLENYGIKINADKKIDAFKHIFSHIIWNLNIVKATLADDKQNESMLFLTKDTLKTYPISTSHQKIIHSL